MKKIKIWGLIIISLLFIVGCSDTVGDNKMMNIQFNDPVGFSKKLCYDFGDETKNQVAKYIYEEENKLVILHFDADTSLDKTLEGQEIEKAIVNGREWKMVKGEKDGVSFINYYIQYKEDLYYVEFTNIDSFEEGVMETFLGEITFN